MNIYLQPGPTHSPTHRARLEYAFRLFCAVYGHKPLTGTATEHRDATISYVAANVPGAVIHLSDSYVARPPTEAAPELRRFATSDSETMLFYDLRPGLEPDWLGEIFEWVSCADEYSSQVYDAVGRVPFEASYIGRHRLDPCQPYASIAMCFLQRAIQRVCPRSEPAPVCPPASNRHMVVTTHDVDYLPVRRTHSCRRLAKNAVISLILRRDFGTAFAQARQAVSVAFGASDSLDQVLPLAQEEQRKSVTASYYFLCRASHHRDGNYRITDPSVISLMHGLQANMEVGIHGSYRSLDAPGDLRREYDCLRELGFDSLGGRQHWLRFTIGQLIQGLKLANAAYDTSIGWVGHLGYRAGAAFAFPPYDFDHEQPAPFLEIPLIAADEAVATAGEQDASTSLSELLANSRRYGWGGISVLWHPTAFGGGQFPCWVGRQFWTMLDDSLRHGDRLLSAASFVQAVWPTYAEAGLLPPRSFNQPSFSDNPQC